MKRTQVHKHLAKTPDLFGLPKPAGVAFTAISFIAALILFLLPINPLIKLGLIAGIPSLLYLGLYFFFSMYTVESFSKKYFSKKIIAIKNNSLAPFIHDDPEN